MQITGSLIKVVSYISRWIWRLAVVTIIAVAALVSLGREMAPVLHKHKSWLEANLSASIGTIVVMKDVSAHWEGLIPEIRAEQLSVGDTIQAERVLMRVDLLKSAMARALVFDALIINQAAIDIPIDASAELDAFNLRAQLEFLFGSADIHINDLSITLSKSHGSGEPLNLHIGELVVENQDDMHWLNANFSIADASKKTAPVVLAVRFMGEASNVFNGEGRAYIDLGDPQNVPKLQEFINALGKNLPGLVVEPAKSVSAKLWLDWRYNRVNWQSALAIDELNFSNTTSDLSVKKQKVKKHYRLDFAGQLAGRILVDEGVGKDYLVYVPIEQDVIVNDRHYPLPVLGLRYVTENQTLFIHVPELSLESAQKYIEQLSSRQLKRLIKSLNPKGQLNNILLSAPLKKLIAGDKKFFREMEFRANLKQVSVHSSHGIPALTSIDGYVQASMDDGFVELDSKNNFSMHYPEIYRSPMVYQQARGRVHWEINPFTSYVYVGSRHIELRGIDGQADGSFWLNIPPHESSQVSEMYLNVGLQNSHVRYRDKYLPSILSDNLLSWLKQGIKGGVISTSRFIYRGPLSGSDAMARTFQYSAHIKDAELKFDAAWPALKNADVALLVDNETVQASIQSAALFDLKVRKTKIDVDFSSRDQPPFLVIRGNLAGPANDGLRLLRETTLRKTFDDVFDSWQLDRDIAAHVDLGITLGTAQEKDYQNIRINFVKNNFLLRDINFPIDRLSGELHYSSTRGVSAQQLTGLLWGKEQAISIAPVMDDNGFPDIAINMNGNVDPQRLAQWSHLPFLHFLKGEIAAGSDLVIAVDRDKAAEVEPAAILTMYSDLQDVAVDLPAPLKKESGAIKPITVKVELWKARQRYQLEYANLVSAVVEQMKDRPLRGDVAINRKDSVIDVLPEFLRIRGSLDRVRLMDWLSVIEQNTQFSRQDTAAVSPGTAVTPEYPVFEVEMKQLEMGTSVWEDVSLVMDYHTAVKEVRGETDASYWKVAFQTPIAVGAYRYFDAPRLPELDLERYLIKTEANAEIKITENSVDQQATDDNALPDPLADMIPQDLPALKVHTKHLFYNDADIGEWRFVTRPDNQGISLEDLQVSMPGLQITGSEKSSGAHLYWRRDATGHMETVAQGKVLLGDGVIPPVLGLVPVVEAENTRLEGKVSWSGSPVMMSFRRMQGNAFISSKNGRFLNSTATTDAMRVINVFNFSTWARRLQLDFSDLYKKGISYDEVKTRVNLDHGKLVFTEPLVMDSPSSRFVMQGSLDSVANTIDASMVVTLPVSNNATWIAALAAGLPVAAGVWAVSKIFEEAIDSLSSIRYSISGTLDDPQIKFEQLLPGLTKDKPAAATVDPANQIQ